MSDIKSLALYHKPTCPYCQATRRVMQELSINIELRDIVAQNQFRKELVSEGGKQQVPCLKIQTTSGEVEWLYESQDIMQYFRDNQAQIS